jgi:hypothetical protein
MLEELEPRHLPSVMTPAAVLFQPQASMAPGGFTPAQIRHAYGFDNIQFNGDGTGQTIAIVDAFDDPNIMGDLQAFDQQCGLAAPPSFSVVAQDGSANLPGTDQGDPVAGRAAGAWESETALDVEWAHAIAPGANILLVEANDSTSTNLFAAVKFAASQAGVSVVSMSWSAPEWKDETTVDAQFVTPAGHTGVTFVTITGDTGMVQYPATSPNVLSVGGTTLTLDGNNNVAGETAWNNAAGSSGGGASAFEALPNYQNGVAPAGTTGRATPDVAYAADSGFSVFDSFNNPMATPWIALDGTSAGAPQWAALIAIADQGRALNGLGTLDGPSQTLPAIYSLPSTDFHDITQGSNASGLQAGPGYDLVTGRGSPIADRVVADLVNFGKPLPPPAAPGTGLAVINYGAGAENVFRVGTDGNLWVDHFDPSSGWGWVMLGNPGAAFAAGPVAINYGGDSGAENVFLNGTDGNLYADHFDPTTGNWGWGNLGNPGAGFASSPVPINYGGDSAAENVFVTGTDGNLYADHFDPSSGWGWVNLGNPGVGFASSPVAINYGGVSAAENVFLTGTDGNLYSAHYDPVSGWGWVSLGNPGGVTFTGGPVAINYGGDSAAENVFLTGTDGNLYAAHFDPSGGWGWAALGSPGASVAPGVSVSWGLAGVNYGGDSAVENVFVTGTDGNLYAAHFDPSSGWGWTPLGSPGMSFSRGPVAINYGGDSGYENVFLNGIDHNLYVDHYDPSSGWGWVNLGNPGA